MFGRTNHRSTVSLLIAIVAFMTVLFVPVHAASPLPGHDVPVVSRAHVATAQVSSPAAQQTVHDHVSESLSQSDASRQLLVASADSWATRTAAPHPFGLTWLLDQPPRR